jgi:LPPG:FO 2-phospho-L-lactate transferase
VNKQPHILALAGGVGGGKLARGLAAVLPPDRLTIVVNTADDFVHLGLHISPDIDSVLYSLADLNDPQRGWGLADETWNFMAAMDRLGGETWFRLGDRDLATHILRTQELAGGRSLSETTALLSRRLGIAHSVAPMSDDAVRSVVRTEFGRLAFQDYFVRRKCDPVFLGVEFEGVETAKPGAALADALHRADAVVVTPSNPFVSIDPILEVPGVAGTLRRRRVPIVAVSPIVAGAAIKGPLAKMMRERGMEVSPLGVARHYGSFITGWIVDKADRSLAPAIEELGCRVRACPTVMRSSDDKARLASEAVEFARALAADTLG